MREGKGKREKGGGGKKNKLLGLSLIFEKVKILEQLLELKKEVQRLWKAALRVELLRRQLGAAKGPVL